MSISCSDKKNIMNSDCLIANSNRLLVNKKLRWIIYQNIDYNDIGTLDDFIDNIIPDNTIPYIDIMGFNDPLPDSFNNNPATVFIMDGFLMSSKNRKFKIQTVGTGYILILFDKIENLIDYSNVQKKQIMLAVDTSLSNISVGQMAAAQTYQSQTIELSANKLYRISIIHFQNNIQYKGLNLNMVENGNVQSLDESILFSYANDSSLNNTLLYRNNNNTLNGYLKWDYFSQDKGDYNIENYTDPNIKPPNSLAIFNNDPLNISGLYLNNRSYNSKINIDAMKVKDVGHKAYFKYIIDGFINFPPIADAFNLNLKVIGGFVMVLLIKVSFDPTMNILDVTDVNNIIFSSTSTSDKYLKSKNLEPGLYRLQIIFTSGNMNMNDMIGYDLQYNIKGNNMQKIPEHWLSTDYLIDYKTEYNNAVLLNCGINDNDWYTNDGCLEAINNSFLNELDLRTNNSKKFRDLISSDCKDISIADDPILYNNCTKYKSNKIEFDKCFDLENDIIKDESCLILTGSNKMLYQKYLDNCAADVNNFNNNNCKKFAESYNINLYDIHCTAANILNDDKKKYIESSAMFNLCKANMSDDLKAKSDLDLFNYCHNDINTLFEDEVCKNLKEIDRLKLSKCFDPSNINSAQCQDFILNPNNLGMVSDNIITYCNTNYDDPLCSNFYNDDQTDANIKNDYYSKIVKSCTDMSKNNNFTTPNTICYNLSNNLKIDPITGRSPSSYFTKNIIEYCSRGKNILSTYCQSKYNNLKGILSLKTDHFSNYRNNDYGNIDLGYDDLVIYLIVFIFIFLMLSRFLKWYNNPKKQILNHFLDDELYRYCFE